MTCSFMMCTKTFHRILLLSHGRALFCGDGVKSCQFPSHYRASRFDLVTALGLYLETNGFNLILNRLPFYYGIRLLGCHRRGPAGRVHLQCMRKLPFHPKAPSVPVPVRTASRIAQVASSTQQLMTSACFRRRSRHSWHRSAALALHQRVIQCMT